MKLASWNVNGLRACIEKDFISSFSKINADIFCLQETKMEKGQAEIDLKDYTEYWNSADKKGYSGTAVFTGISPLSVSYGMNMDEHDHEGRMITLEYKDFYLVNVYVPNSRRELARLNYRMKWEDDFRDYVKNLNKIKSVIMCGDFNVAHKEIDLKHPKTNVKNAGFTVEERNKMSLLLGSGFTDFYRYLYPDKKDVYTWWSYMRNARAKNTGWRIDYFIGSDMLKSKLKESYIYSDIPGSDHCPVAIEMDIE